MISLTSERDRSLTASPIFRRARRVPACFHAAIRPFRKKYDAVEEILPQTAQDLVEDGEVPEAPVSNLTADEYLRTVAEHCRDLRSELIGSLILKTGTRRVDAEDAVQEAFFEAIKIKNAPEKHPRVLGAWLHVAAFYCLASRWRKDRRLVLDTGAEATSLVERLAPVNDEAEFIATRELVHTYMGLLGEKQRRILHLHVQGQNSERIAGQLGIDASTVRSYISQARQDLRKLARADGWQIIDNQFRSITLF